MIRPAHARNLLAFTRLFGNSVRDLAPIVLVIGFFQAVVLRQPFPDVADILVGLLLIVLGLTLFVRGLEMGLFPIGETMAEGFGIRSVARG